MQGYYIIHNNNKKTMKEYVGIYIKKIKTENAQKQNWDGTMLCCIHYYWCIIIIMVI